MSNRPFGQLSCPSPKSHAVTRCGVWLVVWIVAWTANTLWGDEIQFNRDIRPILSENCYKCHGPDRLARQAELRLDQREVALSKQAIVPGDVDQSKLIQRILSDNPDEVMPPPDSMKSLTPQEKDLLKRWVASGAEYQPHWSFIRVSRVVPVPAAQDPEHWIRNPIDAFVLDRLQKSNLSPALETSQEKWLRRVTFDLTGLPPTLPEMDDFLADMSGQAYEKVVDRLLASPAFGERMAVEWLDVARYADTYGYQSDRDMHMWPWRDWVIEAFNSNLSYRDFIVWQTAGDMLHHPTRNQVLATAFNRLHRQTNEGGSIAEEFRQEYISDRVRTNSLAFLGLTFECARCHEHKFDPISQQEYYQMAAFFGNIDEHGLYSHFTEVAPTPTLFLYEADQESQHRQLLSQVEELERTLANERQGAKSRFASAAAAGPSAGAVNLAALPSKSYSFDDGMNLGGENRSVPGKQGQAIEFTGEDAFVCKEAPRVSRVSPFSLSLFVRPKTHRPRMVIAHRSVAAEDAAFRGFSLVLDQGVPVVSLIHFWPGNALQVRGTTAIALNEWTTLALTYDGSSKAAGIKLYVNGRPVELVVTHDSLTRDMVYRKEWGDYAGDEVELSLGARFRDAGFMDGAVDEVHVFGEVLTPLEIQSLAGISSQPTEEENLEHYLARQDPGYAAALAQLRDGRVKENDFVSRVRQIMVMRELAERRPTHVLKRGAYDAPGETVEAETPAQIFPMPQEFPRNRLGLAQWYVDERNPLVSRVCVNRFWLMFFGRGIVSTPEDFGSQGQLPSHPDLLDWLARDFMDSGWDVKQFCKMIVLSATYRQSSIPRDPKLYAEDPDNRLLARGPRYRLSAEQLRDNALFIGGLLVPKLGGPSVMPYQPAGLWEESGTGKTYQQSTGEGLYRRSMYSFWRRTSPPPSMVTFDATTREVCTARRERTATPLQALVLLNDPQFVESCRKLAERVLSDPNLSEEVRLRQVFRLTTSRQPSERELAILTKLLHEQREHFAARPEEAKAFLSVGESPRNESLDAADLAALSVTVNLMLNFDECVMKR